MTIKALLVVILITMSPAAMSAFSEITGAQIVSGTIDLQDTEARILAVGIMAGMLWEISCKWVGGRPQCLIFKNPMMIL